MPAKKTAAQADSVEVPEAQINVPAPEDKEEQEARQAINEVVDEAAKKPESKVEEDKAVAAKLKELDKVCKWLGEIDSKRAQRRELIQNLQLLGAKNATIRKVTGLSNAGYLNAQK